MSLNEIKIPKNMNYQKEEFESKNLDHLGIIAGIIDEIGIVEKINEIFLVDSREKVNTGEVVKAIILNGLGFVSRPLYLFPDFFQDKPIEHLIKEGIKALMLQVEVAWHKRKSELKAMTARNSHFYLWKKSQIRT